MSEPEASKTMKFEVLKACSGGGRLGKLVVAGRKAIETPNFIAATSRGSIPHVTPDNVAKHEPVGASYFGLEDFIEQYQRTPVRAPSIFQTPASPLPPLHSFTSTPATTVSVLAPRRLPPSASHMGNGQDHISIFTSTGFRKLTVAEYAAAVASLRPDIAVAMADLNYGAAQVTPTSKRAVRMAERTRDWIDEFLGRLDGETPQPSAALFAPTLPIPYSTQWEYIEALAESVDRISGLAIYDIDIVPDLADYPALDPLPRLSLDSPASPHHILRQIALGADILAVPSLNAISDAGVALTFTFPAPQPPTSPSSPSSPLPLGTDLSLPEHQASLEPLSPSCTCYACTSHHRAYLNHLLSAREMLAWTLLQLHNHRAVADLLAGARASLAAGTFERDRELFLRAYEPEVPKGMGERPRARGYHFKSTGADEKRNKPAWGKLGAGEEVEVEVEEEGGGGEGGTGATPDPRKGVAVPARSTTETPVVPEGDAMELDEKGFAEIER